MLQLKELTQPPSCQTPSAKVLLKLQLAHEIKLNYFTHTDSGTLIYQLFIPLLLLSAF